MSKVIAHSFTSSTLPSSQDLKVGELAVQVLDKIGILYTKDMAGNIIELGKGATKFADLEDVDLTNAKEGSFFKVENGKFVASNTIGNISFLSDVEINNPQAGQYLRYDPTYLAFRNFTPTYNLYQLLDVEVANPTSESASLTQNNQVLYYNHADGKFKTRPRINLLEGLDDVSLSTQEYSQLLMLDSDNVWKNMDLHIVRDNSPTLANNLNANGKQIRNSTYRVQTVIADATTKTLDYATGDYFIVEGVSLETNTQCILLPVFNIPNNSTAVMVVELRQNTGALLIGGLTNIKYEDGKPLRLSGNGRTDIITIIYQKKNTEVTTYITASALNMATLGNGGAPSYRYDKNRYPDVQLYGTPNRYDSYFNYVQLLLNFESELASGKDWYEDKSNNNLDTTVTATQLAIPVYTFGLQESVADFIDYTNSITVSATTPITLDGDFTYEFYIRYPLDSDFYSNSLTDHIYFTNDDSTFVLTYTGSIGVRQDTILTLKIGSTEYTYNNAFRYFQYQNDRYVHIAVVRKGVEVLFFVNGVYQNPITYVDDDPATEIIIDAATINLKGYLNSVRLTSYARYENNFIPPSMRFGLTGGAEDILGAQVFDYYMNIGEKELEFNMFC